MNRFSAIVGISVLAAVFSSPAMAISTSYDAERDTIVPASQSIHLRVQSMVSSIRANQSIAPLAQSGSRLGWLFSGSISKPANSLSGLRSNSRLAGVLSKLSSLSRGAFNPSANVSPAPEPQIYAMLTLGLAMVIGVARRSRRGKKRV